MQIVTQFAIVLELAEEIHSNSVLKLPLFKICANQDLVDEILNATLLKIVSNVIANMATSVIPTEDVKNLKDLFAIRIHVVPIHNVSSPLMEEVCVHVLMVWKEILPVHLDAKKLNAQLTAIVPNLMLASVISVKTHALAHAVEIHIVVWKNIIRFASVMKERLEILTEFVIRLNPKMHPKIHAILHPVVQTRSAELFVTKLNVHVRKVLQEL